MNDTPNEPRGDSDPAPSQPASTPAIPSAPPTASTESNSAQPPSTPHAAPQSSGEPSHSTGDGAGPESAGSEPAGPESTGHGAEGGDRPDGDGPRKRRRRRRRGKSTEGGAAAEGDAPSSDAGSEPDDAAAGPDAGGESAPRPKKKRRSRRAAAAERRATEQPGRTPKARPADAPARPPRARRGSAHASSDAIATLSQMARELLDIEGIDLLGRPRFMEVKVQIPLDSKRDGQRAAATLVEQVLARVREVREHDRALAPGAVYCYFHESAEAETSRPTEPRQVFDGYTSTGRPQFTDFVTMAIERKDEGIDALVDGQDVVVTHVSLGRVLRTQQLHEFGKSSPVFRILGQVDAGLFPVVNGPHKAAFSFQLLRGVTLEGKPRLRLHPVSAVDLRHLADPTVGEILRRFQQTLDTESLRLAGKAANGGDAVEIDEEEFVKPLLQDLARQLSGRARRNNRRTEHAVERADGGQRPTNKASADATAATDDEILLDDSEGTIVILGPRGRVHVYTRDARHITSLMMVGSNIQKRRHEGRWRAADPATRGEFRIALKRRLNTPGDDSAQPLDVDPAAPKSTRPPQPTKGAAQVDPAPPPTTEVAPGGDASVGESVAHPSTESSTESSTETSTESNTESTDDAGGANATRDDAPPTTGESAS